MTHDGFPRETVRYLRLPRPLELRELDGGTWLAALISDLGVWSAYVAIPCVLGYFVMRRKDIPFRMIFWLFGAFILACGTTHLMEALIFWWPAYRLAGVIKLATAVVSWGTVLALVPATPKALAMRSPEELEREVAARREAELSLEKANAELRQQIEALSNTEERFRLLVDGTRDHAIFMLDTSGRVASWNPGAERITQYRANEIIGRHFSCFYPVEGIEAGKPEAGLQAAAAAGRYEEEGWRVRRDGSRYWANVVLTALRGDDGNLRGISKITRDVSERKRAEENARRLLEEEAARRAAEEHAAAIWEERERLRVTLQSIGDAVIATDSEGRVTLLNPVAEALTGWTNDDAAGKPLPTVFHIINEQTHQPAEDPVAKVMREGRIVGLANHTGLVAADGTVRPIEDSAAPIRGEQGQTLGVVLVFRDATDKKRSEEMARESQRREKERADELEAILRAAPTPIWIAHDPQCLRVTGNPAAVALLGTPEDSNSSAAVSPGHDPSKRGYRECRNDKPIPVDELPLQMAAKGKPVDGAEVKFVFDDGRVRYIYGNAVPLRDAAGSVRGCVGAFADVTPLKAAEESWKQAEERLRTQNERLRLLWEAAAVMLSSSEPDAMLRELFASIGPHLGLDTYLNYMVNESADALSLVSSIGIPAETTKQIARLEFGQAIGGTVAALRQPIVATHIQQSEDAKVQMVKSLGIRSYACNPLQTDIRLLGTLGFGSRMRDEFDDDELEFLRTISHYVAVAYERLRLVRQLQEADRRKDEFLAILAHELRNPLAPLGNALELLRRADGDTDLAERARGMMGRQLDQMVRLVDDLLDMSRISRDKMRLRRERVELKPVLQSALESIQPLV
jgi:PAS domain S-box-containing protein